MSANPHARHRRSAPAGGPRHRAARIEQPAAGQHRRRRWLAPRALLAPLAVAAAVIALSGLHADRNGVGPVTGSNVSSVEGRYSTLFGWNAGPADPKPEYDQPVTVGVAFRSDTDTSIAGLRMYRATGEAAAHEATLWNSSGRAVGELTFPATSSSGWQLATFAEPVTIDAHRRYVASYQTSTGYAATADYFDSTADERGSLSTVPNNDAHGNGLFAYGAQPTFPTSSWLGSNYWIDVLAQPVDDPTDPPTSSSAPTSPTSSPSSTPPSTAPTSEPTTAPTTPPTSAPSTTPTPSPSPTDPTGGGTPYVKPGEVGFLGDRSALRVVPDDVVPSGCTWIRSSESLECHDDAVIKNMYVKGGVDAYAAITITDSVIAATPSNWMLVNLRSAGGNCTVTHSTLVFDNGGHLPNGFTTWGVGGINDMRDCNGVFTDNDISGTPDGIDTGAPNTIIRDNYIHDLATLGTYPQNTHNDGIQLFGCTGCVITGNYFDIGWDGEHQNSCFFVSDGDVGNAILFAGNYLSGGGYAFRNIIGTGMVATDNTFRPLPDQYGLTLTGDSASFASWAGNVTTTGQVVPQPRP